MIGDLFSIIFYNPIYNGLIFLIDIVPYADVGVAVIALTIIVKSILSPISIRAIRTQQAMRELEGPLKKIKETIKDRALQAQKTMALYRERGINPFSSLILILIQIPIVFALYWVFFRGGLPEVNVSILYSFVEAPELVNMQFLGLIDMGGQSIVLALFAGLSQFVRGRLSVPTLTPRKGSASIKDDLARSFQIQMRYVLPIVVAVIAYVISSAVALYWLSSNIFEIAQELYVRKYVKKSKVE